MRIMKSFEIMGLLRILGGCGRAPVLKVRECPDGTGAQVWTISIQHGIHKGVTQLTGTEVWGIFHSHLAIFIYLVLGHLLCFFFF